MCNSRSCGGNRYNSSACADRYDNRERFTGRERIRVNGELQIERLDRHCGCERDRGCGCGNNGNRCGCNPWRPARPCCRPAVRPCCRPVVRPCCENRLYEENEFSLEVENEEMFCNK